METLKKLLFLLVSLNSCWNKSSTNVDSQKLYASDTVNTVILAFNKMPNLSNANNGDTLGKTDMTVIDSLTEYIVYTNWIGEHGVFPKDTFQSVRPINEILKYYKRQMICYRNVKNEKIVWINFFCNGGNIIEWKTDWVFVDDGGDCYFNLKINLSKRKAFDIRINGY